MDRTNREILIALLTFPQSMYALEQERRKIKQKDRETPTEKPNYASVYRHVKKMQKEGLLTTAHVPRKNGSLDKRGTEKPEITPKGLVTLLIEGDLQRKELRIAGMKLLEKSAAKLPTVVLTPTQTAVDDVLFNTILTMKPKLNLEFFDEKYFYKTLKISLVESLIQESYKMGALTNERTKSKVEEYGRTNIPQRDIDAIRDLHELIVAERDTYDRYAKFLERSLEALKELKE
jgi:DNA-binding PadR family transcriptional regulator